MPIVTCVRDSPISYTGDVLVLGIQEGTFINATLDQVLGGAIAKAADTLKPLKCRTITTLGKLPFHHLVLIGLGKDPSLSILRKASGLSAKVCRELGAKRAGNALLESNTPGSATDRAQAITEGIILGLYQYTKYKSADKKIEFFNVLGDADEGVRKGNLVANNVALARDLVNESASNKHPVLMERAIRDHLQGLPIKINVLGKSELEKLGLTAFLAVNRGSVHDPRLIMLDYEGRPGVPVALVGKGVTFDTGGLSLKPADSMEDMKMDMAGAAAVFGAIKSAAELKLPVHVLGFLAFTENMPGGDAYKPGDVITAFNKKTIEVLNTDAEGRIVLADTLAYAETFKPSALIDLATLTGACVVALGEVSSGLMGTDQPLMDKIIASANATDDRAWQLPLYEEYSDAIKSDFADVKNIANKGSGAGAQAGAAFLKNFVTLPWCHLDIAGPAWSRKEHALGTSGGTGAGMRLLIHFLEKQ